MIAMTIDARTQMTMSTCMVIQNGDIAGSIARTGARSRAALGPRRAQDPA